jgi:Skp family chaperone for outer membrane proteins
MKFAASFARGQAWWALRPGREKLMIVAGTVLAVAALGDALITAPLEKKLKRAQGESSAIRNKLDTLRQADAERAGAANAGSPTSLREQEAQLRERLQAAQVRSLAVQRRVAEAARLPETLRAIVATVGSARLLELDLGSDTEAAATPPVNLSNASTTQTASGSASTGRRLYRLPISLKVSGTWSELHTLLTQIERHADALQWSTLTLENTEWPAIQLTLKAHVLSHDPRWGASS